MGVKCFLITESDKQRAYLRRYASNNKCTGPLGYHNAEFYVGDIPIKRNANGTIATAPLDDYKNDPRWPAHCVCGYVFMEEDLRQLFTHSIYVDTAGTEYSLRNAPPGAMWNAWWLAGRTHWCGPDGQSLIVVLPNGRQWIIDGRASNCTKKDDNVHKCWCRHSTPPNITVDKNCNTCSAGAGSILAGDYHGFLRNGEFT